MAIIIGNSIIELDDVIIPVIRPACCPKNKELAAGGGKIRFKDGQISKGAKFCYENCSMAMGICVLYDVNAPMGQRVQDYIYQEVDEDA